MEPIRVLQVVTTMERAGLETMLMNYYRHIDRNKVQFDFLKHRDGVHAYDDEIRELGGKIYTVPPFNPLNTNSYIDALDAFFREHREYKIVHSHLDCLSAVPLKYAKKYGAAVRIAHSHVSKMTFDLKYPVRAYFRGKIPAYATDLFACSDEAGKWMYGKRPFKVVSNAIDCRTFAYDSEMAEGLRKANGLENKFVIAHVGRFDPVKNHVFLLDVFYEITKMKPDCVLLLAGTGNTLGEVKDKAAALGIYDKIRFLGAVSNVPEILQMADVFVFPSIYEGLGISLIEAQAAGLRCFASSGCVPKEADVSGMVRYLDLRAGAKAWADEIMSARYADHDRSLNAGKIYESGYDISSEAVKLQKFYIERLMEEV